MGLPKDKVQPAIHHTYPSERDYFDESKSTLGNGQVTDPAKSGGDYGITDPQVIEPVTTGTAGATNGG